MYSYITGIIKIIAPGQLIIENNGIGYFVNIPDNEEYYLLSDGEERKIWTYLSVSQDAVSLYGFLSYEELELFKKLLTVSGIGPKGALGILGAMGSDDLILAILREDDAAISNSPGIGKKTARKLIIELKDKINKDAVNEIDGLPDHPGAAMHINDAYTEAVEALTALGYSRSESISAVKKVEDIEDKDVETVLKESLKYL